jgi:phospholipase/carboxylesterase
MAQKQLALVHLVREPTIKADGPPPLLLLLHGIGSYEGDLMALAPYLDGRFFVVGARAPLTMGPDSYGWYRADFSPVRKVIDPKEPLRSRAIILHFVDELIEAYHLDPRGAYLMGFSQGAIMSIGVALIRPQWLAGVVAMSGRLLPGSIFDQVEPEALKGLPILVVHGTEDPVLPIENGRQIRDTLETLPVDLTYREYRMGHQVADESLADVTTWLTAQLDKHRGRS